MDELAGGGARGGRARWRRRAASRPGGRCRRSGSGSTVRVASTVRPEACSICRDDRAASSSDELVRGRQLDRRARPCARSTSASNSSRDLAKLARAALLRDEADEVADELVGALGDLAEHVGLRRRVELRVGEERARARAIASTASANSREVARDRVDAVLRPARPRRARARTCAARRPRRSCSSSRAPRSRAPRSPRRSGGAGRRRRAPCRRRAAVASSVRSATSARIWSSARVVSASICLRVSSSRRCRSASASSFARSICASATLRASARMSAASRLRLAMSARCCSSSSRASLRALSASSTACADPVAPLVDRLLDRPERELPEHEERDREADQRPDHQPGDDLDQTARLVFGCERGSQHRLRRGRRRGGRR